LGRGGGGVQSKDNYRSFKIYLMINVGVFGRGIQKNFFFFLRGCVVGKNQKFSNEGITFKFFDKKKKKSELSEGF